MGPHIIKKEFNCVSLSNAGRFKFVFEWAMATRNWSISFYMCFEIIMQILWMNLLNAIIFASCSRPPHAAVVTSGHQVGQQRRSEHSSGALRPVSAALIFWVFTIALKAAVIYSQCTGRCTDSGKKLDMYMCMCVYLKRRAACSVQRFFVSVCVCVSRTYTYMQVCVKHVHAESATAVCIYAHSLAYQFQAHNII